MKHALCLCLLACAAQARLVHESASQFRFEGHIDAGKAIEIQGVIGDVIAEASASGEVQVVAVPKAGTGDLGEVRMQVRDHAGGTTVSVDYSRGAEVEVDFKVRVPAGVKFVGRTRRGRVAATLPRSNVEAHTVDGDVEIHSAGTTRASTVNGSITATLTPLAGSPITDLHTINGSVTVTVPRRANLQLDARAVHGTVTLPGSTGCGGPRLKLGTTHGDIHVLAR